MNWDSLPVIRRIHRISYNDTNTSFQNQIVPDQLRWWWWWLFLSLSLITGIIIMIIIYNNMMMFIIIMLLLLLWFLSYYCDMIFMLLLWHIAIVNDEYFCRSFPSGVPRSPGGNPRGSLHALGGGGVPCGECANDLPSSHDFGDP